MKAEWQKMRVGDCLRLEYGKPLDEADRKLHGRFPVYGANGAKHRTDKAYHGKPSIIVGRKGSAGELNLTEESFWPLDVTYFVTFDEKRYDLRFLYYLLTTLELPRLAKGVKPGINREEVYSLTAKVPDIVEQKRIVGLLDLAFQGIATAKANAEKNLQSARAIFESFVNRDYARKTRLGDLVDIRTGKLDANASVASGRYPFFTCSRAISAIDTFAFDCEAILLAGNNAVGDFNVKHYKGKFNAYQRTYVITISKNEAISYRFLYFQMLRSLAKFKTQSVGSGTKFLKIGMIKDLEIALPSLDEQIRMVSSMDAIQDESQKLGVIYQRKLIALAKLKQALLHQAFAGLL